MIEFLHDNPCIVIILYLGIGFLFYIGALFYRKFNTGSIYDGDGAGTEVFLIWCWPILIFLLTIGLILFIPAYLIDSIQLRKPKSTKTVSNLPEWPKVER